MKMTFELGTIDIIMFIPAPTFFLDQNEKKIEIGLYFLRYFVTINIKYK